MAKVDYYRLSSENFLLEYEEKNEGACISVIRNPKDKDANFSKYFGFIS